MSNLTAASSLLQWWNFSFFTVQFQSVYC